MGALQDKEFKLSKPVAFIIFNRPETTQLVFEEIRKAKPPKLFLIADGPRPQKPDDNKKCAKVKDIVSFIDWECEVFVNYSDFNLGCQGRVSSGLNWVFEYTEEVIILEDDCVPHPSFFRYCQELLDYYKDDNRIYMISGVNYHFGYKRDPYSYYFSRNIYMTGWATWKRAWKHFDKNMELWPKVRDENWLYDILQDRAAAEYWYHCFEGTYSKRIDSWGYAWTFNCWSQHGLTIVPNSNLVTNVGFGAEATHTFDSTHVMANIPAVELAFPIKHPPHVIQDVKSDARADRAIFGYESEQQVDVSPNSHYKNLWLNKLMIHKRGITEHLKDQGIRRVAIFGAGIMGSYLQTDLEKENYELIAFIDNDVNKQNKLHNNVIVKSVDWVNQEASDLLDAIIISIEGSHDIDIINQLKDLLINKNIRIISWKALARESTSE